MVHSSFSPFIFETSFPVSEKSASHYPQNIYLIKSVSLRHCRRLTQALTPLARGLSPQPPSLRARPLQLSHRCLLLVLGRLFLQKVFSFPVVSVLLFSVLTLRLLLRTCWPLDGEPVLGTHSPGLNCGVRAERSRCARGRSRGAFRALRRSRGSRIFKTNRPRAQRSVGGGRSSLPSTHAITHCPLGPPWHFSFPQCKFMF